MANTIYADIVEGKRDNNIKFSELQALLIRLGFECRIKGIILYTTDMIYLRSSTFNHKEIKRKRIK